MYIHNQKGFVIQIESEDRLLQELNTQTNYRNKKCLKDIQKNLHSLKESNVNQNTILELDNLKIMKDELGERMKEFYEHRFRTKLPRRAYTIIRIDGKAFHTYTKGLNRPFDDGLIEDMNNTAIFLCKNIMGAKMGYVQSDEISILLTDFDTLDTQAWFDYNIQKMVSIAASLATSEFNRLRLVRSCTDFDGDLTFDAMDKEEIINFKMAQFDARVFQIPSRIEVENYFIWRQQDATRNSISSVAQSLYSHKELNGKKTNEMQEMIFQKGINWNDYDFREKRGAVIGKVEYEVGEGDERSIRSRWEVIDTPIFTQDRVFFTNFY
jgi:tRNA(His) guanylyltransferase